MKDLYKRFKEFSKLNFSFTEGGKVLLAVSGGVDSMVMLSLFLQAKIDISIAHCNFGLRGKASDEDEKFVKNFAKKNKIVFHSVRFNTDDYATQKNISMQMAARELRYQWFQELRQKHGYRYIATAHHKNDSAETIIYNFIRGTFTDGLAGISAERDCIIRPLLFADKKEILVYAKEKKLEWREDASNSENKYKRNFIRNELMPLLEKVNPDICNTLTAHTSYFALLKSKLETEANTFRDKFFEQNKNGSIEIFIRNLPAHADAVLFFELTKHYGFSFSQINDLYECLNSTQAKIFLSASHTIRKERFKIIIAERGQELNAPNDFIIKKPERNYQIAGTDYKFSLIKWDEKKTEKSVFKRDCYYFDADKISFPLRVRKWQKGDKMKPLGMTGNKNISDILIDLKTGSLQKEKQMVMLSGNEILWLCGSITSQHSRITSKTKNVLLITRIR